MWLAIFSRHWSKAAKGIALFGNMHRRAFSSRYARWRRRSLFMPLVSGGVYGRPLLLANPENKDVRSLHVRKDPYSFTYSGSCSVATVIRSSTSISSEPFPSLAPSPSPAPAPAPARARARQRPPQNSTARAPAREPKT